MNYPHNHLNQRISKSRINGRQLDGFSIRRALEDQGVTTEEEMRRHINNITAILLLNPQFDVTTYRVNDVAAALRASSPIFSYTGKH